jgi:DNA repair exonuclease SbcCD ATPase subunit
MIPKRVILENFLSFGPKTEIAFTDDEPLWVLGGPNGVGKSAVFDAITFCLFGAHRGGAKEIDPLIRHGANGFSVSFEFEFNEMNFKITRNRAGNRTTQSVEQRKQDSDGWERVPNINSVADVRAWSERTLGLPFDAFKASVLLRQGEADAIILATGTERLKILKKIIAVERYEELSKRVHEEARSKAMELNRLTQLRDSTPEIRESDLAAAQTAADVAENDRLLAEASKMAVAERIVQAKQWAALNEKHRLLKDKIAAANARAGEAEQIRQDKARLDALNAVLPTLSQLVPLRESNAAAEGKLVDLREKFTQSSVEQDRLAQLCEGLRLRIASHRDSVADHAAQASNRRTELEQQKRFLTAANSITQLEEQLNGYDPKLDDRVAAIEQYHATAGIDERKAQKKQTEINALLGQSKKEQKQFESVEVGVKCSRCGQPVNAQHAALERQRIANAIVDLTGRLDSATEEANAAATALRTAETEKASVHKKVTDRDALRQRLADQRRNLEALAATSDITRLREEIARLKAEAEDFEQRRDKEHQSQQALEGELKREKAAIDEKVAPSCKKLKCEVDTLEKTVIANASKLNTLTDQLPESWQATTTEQLAMFASEHNRLKSSRIAERFQQLEEDAARRDEWNQQLETAEAEIQDIPEPARIPIAEAEHLEGEGRRAFVLADRECQQARDALSNLVRQAESHERLKREVEASERQARIHEKLDIRLGKTGLQRELVRDAKTQIVRLANDTVRNLSDGELSIELDHSDESGDEAFALLVRRSDDPIPTEVAYLSGSQKFRNAISVALAIGRFAAGQARPLECVIIDEGFGSLDKDGLRFAAEELNRLKQYLRRILLVSHQEEFTGHFPVVIRLSKGENGTVAEAVRR